MLKITLLHYSCPPVVGGVEEIVRQQASLFHRYFHPVKILAGGGDHFTTDYSIELNPLLSSRNPEILTLQQETGKNEHLIERFTDKIYAYLTDTLADFDILIAHNVFTMPYNLPLTRALHRLAESENPKLVSWNHDSPYFYDHYNAALNEPHWQILRKKNPNIFYTTISDSRAREFKNLYRDDEDIPVIPNGIDPIRFFRLNPLTVRLIQETGLFGVDLILVQPSRLHPRKNIELSIAVLDELKRFGLKVKLLLTGAYDPHEARTLDYFNVLQDLANSLGVTDELILLAEHKLKSGQKLRVDRALIRDLYQISDLLFLPSKIEGFGIPLLEAGMIKLPVFCSDIPPFRSIGSDNVYYFALTDSPSDIAKKILDLLPKLKPHNMFRNVMRNYVWDNIYRNRLLPFLKRVHGNRK